MFIIKKSYSFCVHNLVQLPDLMGDATSIRTSRDDADADADADDDADTDADADAEAHLLRAAQHVCWHKLNQINRSNLLLSPMQLMWKDACKQQETEEVS